MAKRRTKDRKVKDIEYQMAEFGGKVMVLKPKSKGKLKFESRWLEGIWVGVSDESNEYRVITEEGMVKSARVQRLAKEQDRWKRGLQDKNRCMPWDKRIGEKDGAKAVHLRLPEDGIMPNMET